MLKIYQIDQKQAFKATNQAIFEILYYTKYNIDYYIKISLDSSRKPL